MSPLSFVVFALAMFVSISASAQYFTTSHNATHFQNRPSGFITQLPPAPPETNGDGYWYDEMITGDIYMKDSTALKDLPLRIDMLSQRIEINHGGQIKILPFNSVLSVSLRKPVGTELLINPAGLKSKDKSLTGLCQVVAGEKVVLLKTLKAEVVKANYNVALDVGRRDNEIVLVPVYYLYDGKNLMQVGEGRGKFKKEFMKNFGEQYEEALLDVNPKKEEDLVMLVQELGKA